MISYTIDALKTTEIEALLDLQRENLKINLTAEVIDSQGFVTFVYDEATISGMMTEPQIIARDGGEIIGYALTTRRDFALQMPLMRPLALMLNDLSFENKPLLDLRCYIIGQVCVKAGYRGLGVFDNLYQGHRQMLSPRYDCCVTEIDYENKRSLAAHKRVGFHIIHDYVEAETGKHWAVVLLKF